ncbi:7-cyano-7-deazaguanine synthase [Saccharothrix sp. BKS2]|uniref:7-cyano-7-deazaguanine synthase n=1 Tax=Saccharothrix sp. BKS2 TaxID=3064400 RepID=UPI0039E786C6
MDITPSDAVVRYWSGSSPHEQRVRFGVDARLDGTGVVDRLSRHLPVVAADLLDFAASVYALDRMVERPRYRGFDNGDDWGRRIRAVIQVREPDRWAAAQEEVHMLLEWLTDDRWECSFARSSGRGLASGQGYLVDFLPEGVEPVLFSGGLDSSAGLAVHAPANPLLPVSVVTNGHMAGVQREVLRRLGIDDARHLQYNANLKRHLTGNAGAKESSQRSRGLLFLASGAATALTLGVRRLWFCENGIGAVNLPYIRSQLGAQATRSAHPKTVALMQNLVRELTGERFVIHNPFLGMTKAEVLSAVPQSSAAAMSASVSCDTSFAARVKGHPPCGVCTSCLLRRQAVAASTHPWIDEGVVYRRAAGVKTANLVAMLWQASRLADRLRGNSPWPALLEEFPTLSQAARFVAPEVLTSMFATYTREWPSFLDSLGLRVDDWFGDRLQDASDGYHSG